MFVKTHRTIVKQSETTKVERLFYPVNLNEKQIWTQKHELYDDFNENSPIYICWHVKIADFIWTVETSADKELGIFSLSKSSTPNRSWFRKRELVLYHFLADQTSKSPSQALLIQLIN